MFGTFTVDSTVDRGRSMVGQLWHRKPTMCTSPIIIHRSVGSGAEVNIYRRSTDSAGHRFRVCTSRSYIGIRSPGAVASKISRAFPRQRMPVGSVLVQTFCLCHEYARLRCKIYVVSHLAN